MPVGAAVRGEAVRSGLETPIAAGYPPPMAFVTRKRIFWGCLGTLVGAVALVLALAAAQPGTYRIERTRPIPATEAQITPHLTDLRRWSEWNPWADIDPNMTLEFSDPAAGEGAWYTWASEEAGAGKMTVVSIAPREVRYALEFTEPFASEADVVLTLEPAGEMTEVTWAMEGENDLGGKVVSLFFDMDTAIGGDFERGLAKLEGVARATGD